MSKRRSEIPFNNAKRTKNEESFWEDDLDDDCFDAIADKILSASQIPNEDRNVSILPTYESFKPQVPCASTQIQPPPPRNYEYLSKEISELKIQIEFLQQKCEAKEGEVTILRTNLQKIKEEMHEDAVKKQNEYLDTINSKEKEIKAIKSELQFKNLEVANLKQKNSELSRLSISAINQIEIQRSKTKNDSPQSHITVLSSKSDPETIKELELKVISEPCYPLIFKFPDDFFNIPTEVHVVESKCNLDQKKSHNSMNNISDSEIMPSSPESSIRIGTNEIGLKEIFPKMISLVQKNNFDLNKETSKKYIEEIFWFSCRLIENFRDYLIKLEKYYSTEDIEELDKNYLNLKRGASRKSNKKFEVGVSAAKTIEFIAELLNFSELVQNLILKKTKLPSHYQIQSNACYLTSINERKSGVCHSFLKSVVKLLGKLSENDDFSPNLRTLVYSLIESVLFTRPQFDLISDLLVSFRNLSNHKDFLDFLCSKSNSKTYTSDKKRKVHYFSRESCKFSLFVALFINDFQELNEKSTILRVADNNMCFISKTLLYTQWIHHYQRNEQNSTSTITTNSYSSRNTCDCLKKLYEITIEVAYKVYQHFRNDKQIKILKLFETIVQIFKLLSFNSCEFLEKNMNLFTKYKETCCGLKEMEQEKLIDKVNLDKLVIFDEVPEKSATKLSFLFNNL